MNFPSIVNKMRQQKLCEFFNIDGKCPCKHMNSWFRSTDIPKRYIAIKSPRLLQTRICNGHRCSHKLSILSLPISIRHQIYFEAGLIQDTTVYLHQIPDDEEDYQITLNLLLTSQLIHQEVLTIIYSTNKFFVSYRFSEGLAPVRKLVPKALALMKKLVVCMIETTCECRGSWNHSSPCYYDVREEPKLLPQPHGVFNATHNALIEWNTTAEYLSKHITPSQLALVFVCDVQDSDAARLAVEPFFSITELASCQIRLARENTFKSLAEEAATTATRRSSIRSAPFNFLRLPPELQLAILRLTDLVTPRCEVEVNIHGKYKLTYVDPDPRNNVTRHEYAAKFSYCSKEDNICLCRRFHSAFSDCRCWTSPKSLFLVCKSMREMASETFFSRNRFIIVPSGERYIHPRAPLVFDQFPASIFFQRAQQQNTLHFLRLIDIPLPTYRVEYHQPTEEAFSEWHKTMERIRVKNYLSGTIITIFLGYGATTEHVLTKPDNIYYRFCEPFIPVGLRKFYVHTAQSFVWHANDHHHTQWSTSEQTKHEALLMEDDLEKLVMGKEYSSNHSRLKSSGHFELKLFEWAALYDEERQFH
jgi:hypothetical protein